MVKFQCKMHVMFGLVIWTTSVVVLVSAAAGASSAHCPTACTCDDTAHTSLYIDCQRRITTTLAPADDDLYDELQTFLEDQLTSSLLTSLTITNSRINSIPPAVCKMTSLQVILHLYVAIILVRIHQYDVTTETVNS